MEAADEFCSTRRLLLVSAAVSAAWPRALLAQGQPATPYLWLRRSNPFDLPFQTLATCNQLESEVKQMTALIEDVKKKPKEYGAQFLRAAKAELSAFQSAIKEMKELESKAKDNEFFARLAAVTAALFALLGVVLVSKASVGVLAAIGIVTGPVILGVQLFRRKSTSQEDILLGYARDRTIMFSELALSAANGAAKQLLKDFVSLLGIVVAAIDLYYAVNQRGQARAMGKRAMDKLEALNKDIKAMGDDPKAWAGLRLAIVSAARASTEAYIKSTRATNCHLPVVPEGPTLKPAT